MNKNKIISSLFWKLLERGGTQIVQFIVQIVLARILLPDDYGVIAIVTIFIAVANVFIQSGFNTALIQRKKVDDTDLSSVFYLSLFVAVILYLIMFFTAPLIASFYKQPILTPVFRVLSISLFPGAINSIQQAIIARKLEFKKYFFSSLGGIILSAIIGILLAYKGFGVWALVVQQLVNIFSVMMILWFTVKWRPKLLFSMKRIKGLFSYGWKVLCSSLIDTIYMNIHDMVIGKVYSSKSLAYYNRGKQFPNLIVTNIDGSISSVLLPALSKEQDNKENVKRMVRRAIVTSSYLIYPIMIGLIIVSKPVIQILLTDKWLECVPYLQILCLAYIFWPVHTANLQAINAVGRSDIHLKLEIIKKTLGIIILIITVPMGLKQMAIGQVVAGIISTFINAHPNKKLLNYSYIEQMKDIIPPLFVSILMGLITYSIVFLNLSSIITLLLQVIVGIIIYIILSIIFKLECYQYIIDMIKKKVIK